MRAWAVASLGGLLLGFAGAGSAAQPHLRLAAGKADAPFCQGSVKRQRPRHLSFSFSCGGEDVTGFELQANRALHSVYDPMSAFGCERRTGRSFDCEDIHSGAGQVGSGIAIVSEPLCHRGAHLVLRITAMLDFEARSRGTFTLRGPC